MKNRQGFVYLWKDTKRNKFYLGSHLGFLDDGYTGSNNRFKNAFKSRPHTFRRRILEIHLEITSKELLKKEEAWLQLIKKEELTAKYYNEKRVASGGDIISDLSKEKRKAHREKSIAARVNGHKRWLEKVSHEQLSNNAKYARSQVKNPRGGSLVGDENPSKRSEVRQKLSFSAKERAKRNKEKGIALAIKTYKIIFPNGDVEFIKGQDAINEKYCHEFPLKFGRFVDTGKPIMSNRSKLNPLIGATIEKVK